MKIRTVTPNNRKKVFEVRVASQVFALPYTEVEPRPGPGNLVAEASVDPELGREGFTFRLASGEEGAVHVEQVLEFNQDPGYLREMVLYDLTLKAQHFVEESPIAKREIIRRLGTSASQFYRLLDQTNTRKSVDQMLRLLHVLRCDVEVVVKPKKSA